MSSGKAAAAAAAATPPASAFPPHMNRDDTSNSSDQDESTTGADPDKLHDLEAGDHVVRWTHIALYPVQVHGIVLSAGPGFVTLVDFGVASRSGSADRGKFGPSAEDDADAAAADADEKAGQVSEAADGGDGRLEIITLVDDRDIKRWRRVDYGSTLPGGGKLRRLMSWILPGGGDKDKADSAGGSRPSVAASKHDEGGLDADDKVESEAAATGESSAEKEEENDEGPSASAATSQSADGDTAAAKPKTLSSLPASDPKGIVLARVRYLLENECVENGERRNSVLPPYHVFNANSECIAVWCKTGRFSTLQAAIFLHSTAIGQAKSAATLSLFVASQTVPITVPAGGVLGWFGMTTTTMVPLVSVQPWLIPALAGCGLAAVGTPYLLLVRARGKWEEYTKELNDGFWAWASTDVYVEAIRGWSGLTD